ncbi:MAG: PAS domain-containing protein [Flavobacteriaceae bacterium]|nr:MAG: PAS domain-containing protein [Flavobacteriaceae bacterium]
MESLVISSFIKDYPASVVIVNSEMQIIDHSKLWLKELQNTNQSSIGLPLYELINYTSEEFSKCCEECLQGGEITKVIQKLNNPGVNTQWLEWTISPWKEYPGKNNGLIIVKNDITETKRKEELLLKAKSIARIGGWEVDLVANTVHWTQVTKEIHEVPMDYIPNLEEGINFYKEGADRNKITNLVSDAIKDGVPWDTELRIITGKGKELWVRAKGEVEIINNKVVRLYGTFQDIDEKKRVELKYEEVSDRLLIATKVASIGIWDYNIVENTLVWDDNMYALYALKKEDFSGVVEAWESTVHPEDIKPTQEILELAIKGEIEFNTEFRVVWPNGEVRYIKAIAHVIRDSKGEAIKMIGANWDFSKDKMAEKKLKNLLDITSEQNNSLMNFAHIVSHNLRSHSSNLSMLTGFFVEEKDNDEKDRLTKMLCEASESLEETVQHLTEVVQVKTDAIDKMRPVNLYKSIKGVEKNLVVLLKEKNTICKIDVGKNLQINAIPAYIDSILLNLFTNSLKYSSPERSLAIKISAESIGQYTIVTFSDNGLGIDLKRHGDKIFGMYKTFHKHEDAKGIGLFITKNQIESMNGKIEVDSQVDKGTEFQLFFEAIND